MTDYWAYEIGKERLGCIHTGPSKDTSGKPWLCDHIFDDKVYDMNGGGDPKRTIEGDAKHRGIAPVIEQYPMVPGDYHPRIWRGGFKTIPPIEIRALSSCGTAIAALLTMLEDIFRTIEPDSRNDASFGHRLRQVLVLACTEVEASCVGVLKANKAALPVRPTTNDYVKLLPVMRLDEWAVSLIAYPDYPAIKPFHGWSSIQPSQSLDWYDAYNATKHDREANLAKGTLRNTIRAAAAMVIMGAAQFGPLHWAHTELATGFSQTVFRFDAPAAWQPSQRYYPPERIGNWREVPCDL